MIRHGSISEAAREALTQPAITRRIQNIEKSLGAQPVTSGLPLLEALNIGAIDLSADVADVADAVPPFAFAAGAKPTYCAIETPSPRAQGIVVRKDSRITGIARLKGQKVGFAKGAARTTRCWRRCNGRA